MRPPNVLMRFYRRAISLGAASALGVFATSCGGGATSSSPSPPPPPAPPPAVASVEVTLNASALLVSQSTQAAAVTKDGAGNVLAGRTITWTTSNGAVATISPTGLVTAVAAGTANVIATSEGKDGTAEINVSSVPVASITVSPLSVPLIIGQTVALSATLKDSAGGTLLNRTVTWGSSDPTVASISTAGVVTGVALGNATVTATSEGKTGSSDIAVSLAPLAILSVSPDTLRPGGSATLTMQSLPAGMPTVTIGPLSAHVASVTGQSITVDVPNGFGCDVPAALLITVTSASMNATRSHPLAPSPVLSLDPGQVLPSVASSSLTCLVVGPASGHYYALVYNVSTTPGASTSFQFVGHVIGTTSPSPVVAADLLREQIQEPSDRARAKFLAGAAAAHLRQRALDSVSLVESANRSSRTGGQRLVTGGGAAHTLASGIDPTVGHASTPRGGLGGCTNFSLIAGRTVFSGAHIIIIEDNASPTAGTLDPYWDWLGNEFDTRMFPLGQSYFGNLFARDISGAGKLLVVGTPRVNAAGAAGFGGVCGFWPRSVNPASNEMPEVSINVPLNASEVAWWETYGPGVLMHESFHEIHESVRLAQTEGPNAFETQMMGEGLAEYATAIYLQTRCGWPSHNETGFAAISQCESHESGIGHPLTVIGDFLNSAFATYISGIETHSPLSDGYSPSTQFIRQAIDNSGLNENATLKSLVSDVTRTGLANLVAHLGRPFDLLMQDWAIGVSTDGYAGFVPAARYQIPAWNIRDIYLGMRGAGWTQVNFPIALRALTTGPVNTTVPTLVAGGTSVIEFRPTTTGSFALTFAGIGGSVLDPNIRVALIRMR